MKLKYFIFTVALILIFSCTNKTNTPEFIKKTSGNYLYNSDEVIQIYFEDNELLMKWRGANNIKPLKVNNTTFFVKEMNEKIQFLTNPSNKQDYIVLVPKDENKPLEYNYKKLLENEIIPSEYLKNNEYNKALEGYLAIQKNDSLDPSIKENIFNRLGYKELRNKNNEKAIQIFKINVELYPSSSNVFDSLGEAFMKNGDTAKAIINYQKSLELDSGNSRAKRQLKKLQKNS